MKRRTPDPHVHAAQLARAESAELRLQLKQAERQIAALSEIAPATELSAFSTDDLLAEIVRRRRDEAKKVRPQRFCDDCIHFKTNPNAGDHYNPCQKGHAMNFWMEGEDVGPYPDAGFFRTACEDRA